MQDGLLHIPRKKHPVVFYEKAQHDGASRPSADILENFFGDAAENFDFMVAYYCSSNKSPTLPIEINSGALPPRNVYPAREGHVRAAAKRTICEYIWIQTQMRKYLVAGIANAAQPFFLRCAFRQSAIHNRPSAAQLAVGQRLSGLRARGDT